MNGTLLLLPSEVGTIMDAAALLIRSTSQLFTRKVCAAGCSLDLLNECECTYK